MAVRPKSKPDDELAQEIAQLRDKERAFLRENARLREDAHAGLEVSLAYARERFGQMAQNARLAWGADPRPLSEMVDLAAAYAASRPEFAAALHAAIDGPPATGAPDFSSLTRKEYEKERDRFRREIAEREFELERRQASRRKAEAERELAAVEEKAAATLGNAA